MRPSRAVLFWSAVIVILVVLEVAEIMHVFTLGFASILDNPLTFIFALFLITILALVGALFVGIFIAHRILSPGGFTPFEEEMLKTREYVKEVSQKLDKLVEELERSKGPR